MREITYLLWKKLREAQGSEVVFRLSSNEARELERILYSYDDLLEALKELVYLKDYLKHADPHDYECRKPLAWEGARAAIAKARGEVTK